MSGDLHLDQLGAKAVSPVYKVTPEATIAYARATNDESEAHLSGRIAPPVFAVVPALKTMAALKRQACSGFTLHGEHDISFERPIIPGMSLQVEAEVVGIRPTPAGPLIVVRGDTMSEDGILVNRQYLVCVAHGRRLAEGRGDPPPGHRRPDGLDSTDQIGEVVHPIDDDQTLRYAEASGDRDPYTFDHAEARARGLPGAIVHGLCSMAMVGRAVVDRCCDGDSRRLRRLAVRFSGLLLMEPGQILNTRIWRAGRRNEYETYVAESDDRAGKPVIRHGWAEIAD